MSGGLLILSIFMGLLLKIYFSTIRNRWPLVYMSFTSFIDPIERRSMSMWLAFRSAPVFISAIFLANSAERWGQSAAAALVVMSITHVLTMYARPLTLRICARSLEIKQAAFWSLSVALVAVANLLGFMLKDLARPLVPAASEMVGALWTGAFAAITAGAVIKLLTRDEWTYKEDLFEKSLREIPAPLLQYAKIESARTSADVDLVIAVMIVENLQRPKWLRKIENVVGRFRSRGTYGIMQVAAGKPISDEESIRLAIHRCFQGTAISGNEDWWEKANRLNTYTRKHNTNPVFIELVREVLTYRRDNSADEFDNE